MGRKAGLICSFVFHLSFLAILCIEFDNFRHIASMSAFGWAGGAKILYS